MDWAAIGPMLLEGARAEFANFWKPGYEDVRQAIGEVIWFEAPSEGYRELYSWLRTVPYLARFEKGEIMPTKGVLSEYMYIYNHGWGRRVPIHKWDAADDRTKSAWAGIQGLAQNAGILARRIFVQFITGGAFSATNDDYLSAIPNNSDGADLYNATDGASANRFGVSGGNTTTATGSTTEQQIITDIETVKRRFFEEQDTESKPLHDPTAIERNGVTLFHGPSITFVMDKALRNMLIQSVQGTDAGAGVGNVLLASGAMPIKRVVLGEITNAAYYLFLRGLPEYKRPLVRQVRQGLQQWLGMPEVSDISRDTGVIYVQVELREGWGGPPPIGTINVTP